MNLRIRLARALRRLADRIDHTEYHVQQANRLVLRVTGQPMQEWQLETLRRLERKRRRDV